MNSDFLDLLKLLEKYQVKYVVIGGYAVMEYSEPRATKDLDILIACNKNNAAKIYLVLKEFGASLTGVTVDFFAKKGRFYKIGRAPNRIDIITSAEGASFSSIYKTKKQVLLKGVKVAFISKANLIKLKKKAGRPQDLADLDRLKRF